MYMYPKKLKKITKTAKNYQNFIKISKSLKIAR